MAGNGCPCEAGQRLELACKEGEHLRGCHRATWTVPTRPADAPFWLEVCESPSLFVGKMNPVPGIKLGERQWEEAGLGSSSGGRSADPTGTQQLFWHSLPRQRDVFSEEPHGLKCHIKDSMPTGGHGAG